MKRGFPIGWIASLIGILTAMAVSVGCGDSLQSSKSPSQNSGATNPPSSSLQVQTRIVLAEMFTGDW
ncbi:hypothetical protein [Dehalogenimonas etheniformans]|nr:hypothetical protein [Dehalogenimonas etheniformans]QNT75747.1 hypothetical protein HX448_03120 [Dehalogenimonas etheniformans]